MLVSYGVRLAIFIPKGSGLALGRNIILPFDYTDFPRIRPDAIDIQTLQV